MTEPNSGPRQRWVWALTAAGLAITINWIVARPDVVTAVSRSLGLAHMTSGIAPAQIAFLLSFVLLGIVPAVAGPRLFRCDLKDLGVSWGDRHAGLPLLLGGVAVAIIAGYVGARSPTLARTYPLGEGLTGTPQSFLPYAATYALYYGGYEFVFRGFLLLGMRKVIGAWPANLLQSAISVIAHVGKPGLELAASFPASLVFGWVTLRTRSVWYAFTIHWVVGVSLDWFIVMYR